MSTRLSAELLEQQVRERALGGTVKIPPYPAIALRLQSSIDQGNFGLADLARITSADGVITATVLRLANSGYYRGSSRVTALPDAISRIGAQELCRVALASSLGTAATASGALVELRRSTWRQALGSALCSQVLAPIRHLSAQQAFLCGLLHDFGRVVAIASLEEIVGSNPAPGTLRESEWLDIVDDLHVELGTLVSAKWNLPDFLVSVMAGHHQVDIQGPFRPLIDLVLAADAVVTLLEDCPYLLKRDLETVEGLGAQEVEALMQYLPLIPGYINGLDDMTALPGALGRSAVEKPESALPGTRVEVDFPVTWSRTSGETNFRARYVTGKGIAFVGRAPMHEGSVCRLRVGGDGAALELSGRVVLCRAEGSDGYLTEVRLFALPGATHGWWDQIAPRDPSAQSAESGS